MQGYHPQRSTDMSEKRTYTRKHTEYEECLFALKMSYRLEGLHINCVRVNPHGNPNYFIYGGHYRSDTLDIEGFNAVETWMHNIADDAPYTISLITDDGRTDIYHWTKPELFEYDLTTRLCQVMSDTLAYLYSGDNTPVDAEATDDCVSDIRTALLKRENDAYTGEWRFPPPKEPAT